MDIDKLKQILEAALLAADEPLSLNQMEALFLEDAQPGHRRLLEALELLSGECANRGVELRQVASGFRLQVKQEFQTWVSRLWAHKPPRYSRALLETLALIAYRQPITRAEIEEVRGVSVSSNIVRTLLEREWVRIVGHRDVPGRPALFGTTRRFLDYFNLASLDELPTLAEIRDIEDLEPELELAEERYGSGAVTDADDTPPEDADDRDGEVTDSDHTAPDDATDRDGDAHDEDEERATSGPPEAADAPPDQASEPRESSDEH